MLAGELDAPRRQHRLDHRVGRHRVDEVRLLTGEGLLHNWPLLPIPEARPARRAFADALLRGSGSGPSLR